MRLSDSLILIPTYNEQENIEKLFTNIRSYGCPFDILFIDDNSPDGTGQLLDGLAHREKNVNVLHRPCKQGIGSAHLDGLEYAYQHGYAIVVTMDGDFSHDPTYIKDFLRASGSAQIVVGSRYICKDSLRDWHLWRRFLTHLAHVLTRIFLGFAYDATGAYRLYRINKIPFSYFQNIRSLGYSFFFESLYIMHRNNITIVEVPIRLPARTCGHSKMSLKQIFLSLICLFRIYLSSFAQKKTSPNNTEDTIEQWDNYWHKKSGVIHKFYDLTASFYRKYVIRPVITEFARNYFGKNSCILHTGCGSGGVDKELRKEFNVLAFDISGIALSRYLSGSNGTSTLIQGDIRALPFQSESIDGIFNLGVMEHFGESDLNIILSEFRRVIKSTGRVLLFWPPKFGLSVRFLNTLHFLLVNVFRKNIKLHPDEISLVKDKAQVSTILEKNGFSLIKYYFGIKDLYTHAIIVAEKNHVRIFDDTDKKNACVCT